MYQIKRKIKSREKQKKKKKEHRVERNEMKTKKKKIGEKRFWSQFLHRNWFFLLRCVDVNVVSMTLMMMIKNEKQFYFSFLRNCFTFITHTFHHQNLLSIRFFFFFFVFVSFRFFFFFLKLIELFNFYWLLIIYMVVCMCL